MTHCRLHSVCSNHGCVRLSAYSETMAEYQGLNISKIVDMMFLKDSPIEFRIIPRNTVLLRVTLESYFTLSAKHS